MTQCCTTRNPPVNQHVAHHALAPAMHSVQYQPMRLAEIRKGKGLSQEALAEMVGVHKSTISRAESMDRTAKLETYMACAEVLGVTLAQIFSEDRSAAELALIEKFRTVPAEKQKGIFDLLDLVREEARKPD